MIAVGIDPSLNCTGLAKITDGYLETLRLPTSTEQGDLADVRRRVRYITGRMVMFVPQGAVAVIEAPIVVRGGRGGLQLERAWLFGFLVDQLFARQCQVVQVRPKVRAKLATGNGNAEKRDVLAAIRERFPATRIADDNVADAVALAAAGARWAGEPIDGALTKKQAEAMASVSWPNTEKREQ